MTQAQVWLFAAAIAAVAAIATFVLGSGAGSTGLVVITLACLAGWLSQRRRD